MFDAVLRVTARQAALGEVGQGAATQADVEAVRADLSRLFGAVLPDDYAAFSRLCNGLDHDGMVLYGSRQSIEAPGPAGFWQGLVAAIAAWREGPGHTGYLVLGETGMDLLTVDRGNSRPALRDRVSGEIAARFDSVAQALNALLAPEREVDLP